MRHADRRRPEELRQVQRQERPPARPGGLLREVDAEQPDGQADEAEHAHDVRRDPGVRRERPGAVQRGLVGVGAESRVENEEDSGDRERDGGRPQTVGGTGTAGNEGNAGNHVSHAPKPSRAACTSCGEHADAP